LATVDKEREKSVCTKLTYSTEALHYALTGSVGAAAFLLMKASKRTVAIAAS
jgi:hypothetical protein